MDWINVQANVGCEQAEVGMKYSWLMFMLLEGELDGLGKRKLRKESSRAERMEGAADATQTAQPSFRAGTFRKNVISAFHGISLAWRQFLDNSRFIEEVVWIPGSLLKWEHWDLQVTSSLPSTHAQGRTKSKEPFPSQSKVFESANRGFKCPEEVCVFLRFLLYRVKPHVFKSRYDIIFGAKFSTKVPLSYSAA